MVQLSEDDGEILGMGSRIFSEPLDAKTKTPTNAKRRAKRMLRRLIARKAERKQKIEALLQAEGMLPNRGPEFDELFNDHKIHPYLLRKKGLDDALTLHEFGRVLHHLCVHRGYKSNRKAMLSSLVQDPDVRALIEEDERERAQRREARETREREQEEREEGKVIAAIAELRTILREDGARTLGEHLARLMEEGKRVRRGADLLANYDREMVEDEFNKLWETQIAHHPKLRNAELRARVHHSIFFQRPLRIQRFLVKPCPFHPSRRRADRALPTSHQYRILQTVNNIRVRGPEDLSERPLTPEERSTLVGLLHSQLEVRWTGVSRSLRLRGYEFNLEQGGLETLEGNTTSIRLERAIGAKWNALDLQAQDELVHDLIHTDRLDGALKRLRRHWGLTAEEAYRTVTTELAKGTMSLSAKAMRQMLPRLAAGERYDQAKTALIAEGVFVQPDRDPDDQSRLDRLPLPPDVRNPVANRALHQLRKVFHAVLDAYGPIDAVHVETTRELKLTKKQKEEVEKQNKLNAAANARARVALRGLVEFTGVEPSRDDLEKYRLWEESEGTCPYTGQTIALTELYGPNVDVEHIIPFPRCWDDSFRNKTLCVASFNRERKRNRTPYECLQGPGELDAVLTRVNSFSRMKRGKKRLFELDLNDEVVDGFLNRQLNDTSIIAKQARAYLSQVVPNIVPVKGGATAILRDVWGLEYALSEEGKDRNDYRHHAADALIVALTSRSLFQKLSRRSGQVGAREIVRQGFAAVCPVKNLLAKAKSHLEPMLVSHMTTRKITGALHEDTAYGLVRPGLYAYRKGIQSLTASEIERIRDDYLRKRIRDLGPDHLKALPAPGLVLTNKHGKPYVVRRVRLTKVLKDEHMVGMKDGDGDLTKFHPKGSNHHVAVYENSDGEREYEVVSTIEVARRAKQRLPLYQAEKPGGWRMVMAWHKNDVVEIEGTPHEFYKVLSFSLDNPVYMVLRPLHRAAGDTGLAVPSNAQLNREVLCKTKAHFRLFRRVVNLSPLGHLNE